MEITTAAAAAAASTLLVKSGAPQKLVDFIDRIAGPMVDEVGAMLGDKVKVYRMNNSATVCEKAEKKLDEADLPAKQVPPRLLIPILEQASLEADDSLQELWAGLLASAAEQADALSPSFIETLKQLTPTEALALNELFSRPEQRPPIIESSPHHSGLPKHLNPGLFRDLTVEKYRLLMDTFERLGLVRRVYDLETRSRSGADRLMNSVERGLTSPAALRSAISSTLTELVNQQPPSVTHAYEITSYCAIFMKACIGPKPDKDRRGSSSSQPR